jgi:hypothetical protein
VNGPFTFLNVPYNPSTDFSGWSRDITYPYPHVTHNVNAVAILGSGLVATIPPHALFMHPGPGGEYAVVRFTAPARGNYKVSGQFYALDDNFGGTTTDVWILKNNISSPPVFSGSVNYPLNIKFSSFTSKLVQLQAGDTLEFEVGYGSNNDYNFDTTGLNAVIEKIK